MTLPGDLTEHVRQDVSVSPEAVTSPACHNCGAALYGRFCTQCGQEDRPLDPALKDVAREVAQEISSVDGRIFRSIWRLFLSPGYLTREHLEGRRARWIAPVRLYLLFSVAYFAVTSFAPEVSGFNFSYTGENDEETRSELGRLGFTNEQDLQRAVNDATTRWMPRAMFVLVPLFAWLVYRVRRRAAGCRYPHFLVFAVHVHAVWFGSQAMAGAIGHVVGHPAVWVGVASVSLLYGLGYLLVALRAVYGGTWLRAVRDAAILIALYWMALIVSGLAIVLPAVLFSRAP